MAEKRNSRPNRGVVCGHWTRLKVKKIIEECNFDLSKQAMVFDVDEHPLEATWDSLNNWAANAKKFRNKRTQDTSLTSKLVAVKTKLENVVSPCSAVQDEVQIPKHSEQARHNLFVSNKRTRLSKDAPSIPFLEDQRPPTRDAYSKKNANVPYKHVLFGNASAGAIHEEVVDVLPAGWQPVPLHETLSFTEVELAYLQEESQFCQKREDFNFVWTYASPQLRIQLRMLTLVQPENYEAFEKKRLEIRQQLLVGERRPLMGQIMAEYRLNFLKRLKRKELTCAPTYEQIFGKDYKTIQLPIHIQNKAPRHTLARKSPSKPKKLNSVVIDGTAPISEVVLPRSWILTEEEQEVVWLGEESILDHPDPKHFDFVFVSTHASAKLKTLLPVRGGRWLPRVIRFHDPKVRVEYSRFRNEVRACLHSGFRRPETKAFLPVDHIPLPGWTLTQMSYAEAFLN